MTLRSVAAAAACIGALLLASVVSADGLPDDEDFNPVPSKPGVPAPGVVQPPPINDTKPAPTPAPAATPAPTPAPTVAPAPTPATPPPPAAAPAPATPPPAASTTTPPAASTAAAPVPNTSLARLYSVTSIDVKLLAGSQPTAEVTVKGFAPTGGWTNVTLRPLETKGGVLELELVGKPPSGPSTQALTNIAAAVQINPLPADVKMIRVIAQTDKALKVIR